MTDDAGSDLRARLLARIRDVPDFPTPGIVFKDITPLLADPAAFAAAVDGACRRRTGTVRRTRSPASRPAGSSSARRSPCRSASASCPVRKKGKLPGATSTRRYELEYG